MPRSPNCGSKEPCYLVDSVAKYRVVVGVCYYAMLLPLLEKAKEQTAHPLLTPKIGSRSSGAPQCGTPFATAVARIPQPPLLPGEQYRFHFDMTKSIGCKCCVVACNEQNGNPAEINWRRVGEIEGGRYPNTHRSLSFDGLQSLYRADMSARLSGGRLLQGSGHRRRVA